MTDDTPSLWAMDPNEQIKRCTKCSEVKPWSEFYILANGRPQSRCKECRRGREKKRYKEDPEKKKRNAANYYQRHPERVKDRNRQRREKLKRENPEQIKVETRRDVLRRYKMTVAEYDELLAAQGGLCAVCKEPPQPEQLLQVDHDHNCCPGNRTCGLCVRGLLHPRCNGAIGALGDCPDTFHAAAQYVLEHRDILRPMLAACYRTAPIL